MEVLFFGLEALPPPAILYNSDRFMVVASTFRRSPVGEAICTYEIMDRTTAKVCCLIGAMAQGFIHQIEQWQDDIPCEAEVFDVLGSYAHIGNSVIALQ